MTETVKTIAIIECEVGGVLVRQFRHMIRDWNFRGGHIEYIESPGWISRTFTLKGPEDEIDQIRRIVNEQLNS